MKRRIEKGGGEKAKKKEIKKEEGKGKRERREGKGANLPSCHGKKWLDWDPMDSFFLVPKQLPSEFVPMYQGLVYQGLFINLD